MSHDRPIVVAGEALMDLVLDPGGGLLGHPGGGPYTVARTVGRLEQPVLYLGRLSTDGFGARLRSELEADSVGVETVVATDAPTTLAIAELNESGGAQYRFYEDSTSVPGLALEEAIAVLPARIGMFCVGALGLIFEPIATTLEAIVTRLDRDTLIALDPNCRPTTIRDPVAYRGRLDRLLRRTDVVKASDDDLAWLRPGASPVDAARALLSEKRGGRGHDRRRGRLHGGVLGPLALARPRPCRPDPDRGRGERGALRLPCGRRDLLSGGGGPAATL